MGPQFHETDYGRRFFLSQLPNLIKALNRLDREEAWLKSKCNKDKDNTAK